MLESSGSPIRPQHRRKAVATAIVAASAAIVGLMSAAVARDDAGVRQFFLEQPQAAPRGVSFQASAAAEAFGQAMPLTIRGSTIPAPVRVAHRKPPRPQRVAARTPSKPSRVKVWPALFAVNPSRPAIVSIYEDRTLRRGDALMTLAGLRVFAGSHTYPYRPEDFTTLTASRDVKGQLRRALIELDQNPAMRG